MNKTILQVLYLQRFSSNQENVRLSCSHSPRSIKKPAGRQTSSFFRESRCRLEMH